MFRLDSTQLKTTGYESPHPSGSERVSYDLDDASVYPSKSTVHPYAPFLVVLISGVGNYPQAFQVISLGKGKLSGLIKKRT